MLRDLCDDKFFSFAEKAILTNMEEDIIRDCERIISASTRELYDKDKHKVTATVAIAGDLEALLEVECSIKLARNIARKMFNSSDLFLIDSELQNSLAELASLIAKYLIRSLDGDSYVARANIETKAARKLVSSISSTCQEEPITVRLYTV